MFSSPLWIAAVASSGGGGLTPEDPADWNPWLWWDVSDVASITEDVGVELWRDQVEAARLQQNTDAAQPLLSGGDPESLSFDGTNDYLILNGSDVPGAELAFLHACNVDWEITAHVKFVSTPTSGAMAFGTAVNGGGLIGLTCVYRGTNELRVRITTTAGAVVAEVDLPPGSVVLNTWQLIRLRFANATQQLSVQIDEGTAVTDTVTGTPTTANPGASLHVGGYSISAWAKCEVSHLFISKTLANSATRNAQVRYFEAATGRDIPGGDEAVATPETILGGAWVDSFTAGGLQETAGVVTSWNGDNGHTLTAGGSPEYRTLNEGISAALLTASQHNEDSSLYSDEAGLGDLLTGATVQGFTVATIHRLNSADADRPIWAWGKITGTAGNSMVRLWKRTGIDLRWRNDAGGTSDVAAIVAYDNLEHYTIVSYDPGTTTLRVWFDGALVHENEAFAPAGAFSELTRFSVAALYNGSATATSLSDLAVAELHFADAGISEAQAAELSAVLAERVANPRTQLHTTRYQIITPTTTGWSTIGGTAGENITFASIVRAAAWHVSPLATYYMLVSGHKDDQIYMGYSNSLTSGWQIYGAGTDLTISALLAATGDTSGDPHVSSPHIVVDNVNERYVCFFHSSQVTAGHDTQVAVSTDLINWTFLNSGANITDGNGVPQYLRPFKVGSTWYAVGNQGAFYRSTDPDGLTGYVSAAGPHTLNAWNSLIKNSLGAGVTLATLHTAVHVRADGTTLDVYYSLAGDNPGRIWHAVCDTTESGDWEAWVPRTPTQLIEPYYDWEGNTDESDDPLPWFPTAAGEAPTRIRQLRDPQLFVDSDDSEWLVYTYAGEDGIGIVQLA